MRKVRMGMVGGGRGAFIGAVHRIAASIDQQIDLVCGAFSSTPEKSKASGGDLLLPADRCYGDFTEMMAAEAALPADQRMDFVSIVTPNHMHFPPAKAALEAGFHVLSDKPATFNLQEAKDLKGIIEASGQLYGLTHNYTGYPMVKQARAMVANGEIGAVRKVVAEYPQGWLATHVEADGQKQAAWRTDPSVQELRVALATSAPTPRISPSTSPAWKSKSLRRTSLRLSTGVCSTTTAIFSFDLRTVPKACSMHRK